MNLEYIDEKTNRIKNLISFGEKQKYFHLDLMLTSRCNYNCYYCTDLHNNNNNIVYFNLKNLELLVKELLNRNKILDVFIYGGEPTLHPQLIDIINLFGSLMKDNGLLEVQSNLAKSKEYFKYIIKEGIKYPCFRINGSYHDSYSNFKEFLNKVLFIKQFKCLKMITVMYNSKTDIKDKFNKLVKYVGSQYCEISPLISGSVSEDPTIGQQNPFSEIQYIFENEDIKSFSKHSYPFQKVIPFETIDNKDCTSRAEMWYNKSNSFTGMLCSVCKERLIISWDGSCYRCFNDMFYKLNTNNQSIFNINDLDINKFDNYFNKIISEEITCSYTKCFFELEHMKRKK